MVLFVSSDLSEEQNLTGLPQIDESQVEVW